MDKNKQRKVVLFFLAASFSFARKMASAPASEENNLDQAEHFLKAAEARGINIGELLANE